MTNLSTNYTEDEFACRCGECSRFTADYRLVNALEAIRADAGHHPIYLNSGFRCRAHNNRPKNRKNAYGVYGAGSNDNSFHPIGGAADYRSEVWTPAQLFASARRLFPDRFGLGLYAWGVHIDIRPAPVNWTG